MRAVSKPLNSTEKSIPVSRIFLSSLLLSTASAKRATVTWRPWHAWGTNDEIHVDQNLLPGIG